MTGPVRPAGGHVQSRAHTVVWFDMQTSIMICHSVCLHAASACACVQQHTPPPCAIYLLPCPRTAWPWPAICLAFVCACDYHCNLDRSATLNTHLHCCVLASHHMARSLPSSCACMGSRGSRSSRIATGYHCLNLFAAVTGVQKLSTHVAQGLYLDHHTHVGV